MAGDAALSATPGSGKARRMQRFLILVIALAAGCSAARLHGDTLRTRASFDMRCPTGQLQVTEIDNRTAGVDGCGQRATYIFTQADTWVLNSPPSGDQLSPAAEPPAEPPPPPAAPPPAEPPPAAPPPAAPPPH
jgi:hypothetical protein